MAATKKAPAKKHGANCNCADCKKGRDKDDKRPAWLKAKQDKKPAAKSKK